jgi:hypothetical protein
MVMARVSEKGGFLTRLRKRVSGWQKGECNVEDHGDRGVKVEFRTDCAEISRASVSYASSEEASGSMEMISWFVTGSLAGDTPSNDNSAPLGTDESFSSMNFHSTR